MTEIPGNSPPIGEPTSAKDGPSVLKHGRLRNNNPPGDFMKAPRCGAKNRQEQPCKAPAIRAKARCRLHGGMSTGAKTKAGIHRIRAAHWKDGSRSASYRKRQRRKVDDESRKCWRKSPGASPLKRSASDNCSGYRLFPRSESEPGEFVWEVHQRNGRRIKTHSPRRASHSRDSIP